ncbi:MAG: hypothetical protein VB071_08720 [Lawsonibacter sp.]|nr:hypothetical protein [Lawsonibacter sp.]
MDERGLWELFYATGLPEAYLAIWETRTEPEEQMELPAKTAFRPEGAFVRQI